MKQVIEASKLYYGFPIFILGYQDETFGCNITTCSSSYSLADMVVIGMKSTSNATKQIQKFKAFTINLITKDQMLEMEQAGWFSRRDKLKMTNVEYVVDEATHTPMLTHSPVVLTCQVTQIVEESGYTHFFAKILNRFVEEDLIDDKNHFESSKLSPVFYLGDGYQRIYRSIDTSMEGIQHGSFMRANRLKRNRTLKKK